MAGPGCDVMKALVLSVDDCDVMETLVLSVCLKIFCRQFVVYKQIDVI